MITHNDAIAIENVFREHNGENWEHSADSIEHDPVAAIRDGLLENLLGSSAKAKAVSYIIEISLANNPDIDVDELKNIVDGLASA